VGTTTIMDTSMHVKMFMRTSMSASLHTHTDMRTVTGMLME
jgi:hypothetical protein